MSVVGIETEHIFIVNIFEITNLTIPQRNLRRRTYTQKVLFWMLSDYNTINA